MRSINSRRGVNRGHPTLTDLKIGNRHRRRWLHLRRQVSYNKLGDVYRTVGEMERLQQYYGRALAMLERLMQAEPGRADLARDLAVSCDRMARVAGGMETAQGQDWFRRAREPLRRLKAEGRLPDREGAQYLGWLEEQLKP